jgi:hypothetical protein
VQLGLCVHVRARERDVYVNVVVCLHAGNVIHIIQLL